MGDCEDVLRGGAFDPARRSDDLRTARMTLVPFDDRVVSFAADLARRLRRETGVRSSPALSALAFWIRPATIERLREEWSALASLYPTIERVPRGLVFHLPPTNVDTMFVYSWLLSALCGNANVIRLSPRSLDNSRLLVDLVREVLAGHPVVAETTAVVTYGHDDALTRVLSTADVRVIWGGDEAVAAIRAIPCAPSTRDLAFPDRFSLAALDASVVENSSADQLSELAHALFNDAYWFDQLGCSSPRLIVWVGDEPSARAASSHLTEALRTELARRRHPEPPTSAVMAKFVHVADAAARGLVSRVDRRDNSLTVAAAVGVGDFERDTPGGGLFYEMIVGDLVELAPHIQRKDQTLTVHGIDHGSLSRFVAALGSRGVDRIVPVGQALQFDRFWDGVDLLVEFTRALSLPPVDES
jgi:hypothetical protein